MCIKRRVYVGVGLVLMILFAFGCSNALKMQNEEKSKQAEVVQDGDDSRFVSEAYGFSFDVPDEWKKVTHDLPNHYAVQHPEYSENVIIMVVDDAPGNDESPEFLYGRGLRQVVGDMYGDVEPETLNKDQVNDASRQLSLKSVHNIDWYTYGMRFEENQVNTIISGTICDEKEVLFVLVSDETNLLDNQIVYGTMLDSFSCT